MRVTAETKNATRERILDVAKRLFAQQGFDAATTRDIARDAQVATGTLFNYFPNKESIALVLVGDVWQSVLQSFADSPNGSDKTPNSHSNEAKVPDTVEEDLFMLAAAVLRKLKPFRKYLPEVLRTSLSPWATETNAAQPSLRIMQLEAVGQIAARHGFDEALSPVALHLYWTLFTGVLEFWAKDRSPRQEDTLALLDQSLGMFTLWLRGQADDTADQDPKINTVQKRG